MAPPTSELQARLTQYKERMNELARRLDVVESFIRGDRNALYLPTTVESIYLQLRNSLEVIATASLTMNQDALGELSKVGRRKWHAGDILEAVETTNPDYYYPKPVRLKPDARVGQIEGYRGQWIDLKGDYLTRQKFATLYDIASKVLHTGNPFDRKAYAKDSKQCRKLIRDAGKWRKRIVNLLTHHYFKLPGEEDWLFLAYTVSEEGKFEVATFETMKGLSADSSDEEIADGRAQKLNTPD